MTREKSNIRNGWETDTVGSEDRSQYCAERKKVGMYTAIDADAPSRKDPYMSEFVHWLVVNIHGQTIDNANELVSYRGPRPPAGMGSHRYYFALFKQQSIIPAKKLESRARFDTLAFATEYGLGEPIAGNFFQMQFMPYSSRTFQKPKNEGRWGRKLANPFMQLQTEWCYIPMKAESITCIIAPSYVTGLCAWMTKRRANDGWLCGLV
ncbi:phosphatidylethanolamine-binding protein [Teladorsagia circumcincta]|uniref:Phosphatidylethanolamine-binding protein n=1 Tax=Teladorsagia circumcincta TaxID=45464 RepID=A0A2G9V192_TELCI|nr:phosphatidylethanolamine-binding protein [Teladorsagia circumcincta]